MKFGIAIAICVALTIYGAVTLLPSRGFFTDLLGAGMIGCGGGAAYLLRRSTRRHLHYDRPRAGARRRSPPGG